ncbi:MAG: DUF4399 domain-containing protein [Schleiferiaceae bacterium]|nr:DUF4399 domain-containing protein [Schleiferiaceae bacterium]
MKKSLLIFGISAALVACGGGADEASNDNAAEQTQEQSAPSYTDTEEPATKAEPTKEERIAPTEGARVYFINLEDGATVSSPVHIEMGVEGMGIKPANEIILGTGHHHILVNNENGFIPQGEIVPMNETNIHFGKGQTEHDLELAPGTYTISLQFANGFHESYGEPMSNTITITVE